MAQIDDLTDEADPVNVPATSDEHPNWRRRLSMTLDELAARPRFVDITEYFRAERGSKRPGAGRRGCLSPGRASFSRSTRPPSRSRLPVLRSEFTSKPSNSG